MERRPGARSVEVSAILRVPAVQALGLQFAALLIVFLMAFVLETVANFSISILIASLAQGAIAAALSFSRKLAPWWLAIQFFFPVVLLLCLSWRLPPALFLAAFLFSLFLYWSTFRTQVPFYPSRLSTWQAVDKVLPAKRDIKIIDIGSGFGGLILHLARQRSSGHFIGIEIAPLPWVVSALRARLAGGLARFQRGDYRALDFAEYDVVFAYLSPVAMPALWEKAHAEMRSGSLLISYEFPIPGVPAHTIVSPDKGGPALHIWQI